MIVGFRGIAKHPEVLETGDWISGATMIYRAISTLFFMLARVLCTEIGWWLRGEGKFSGSIKSLEKGCRCSNEDLWIIPTSIRKTADPLPLDISFTPWVKVMGLLSSIKSPSQHALESSHNTVNLHFWEREDHFQWGRPWRGKEDRGEEKARE